MCSASYAGPASVSSSDVPNSLISGEPSRIRDESLISEVGDEIYGMDVLTLILVSVPAGFLGALVGLGGGVILIPLLTMIGVPIKYAIAASIVAIAATSGGSAYVQLRERLTNVRVALFLEAFTVSGAILGAVITLAVPPRPLYIVFASLLLASVVVLRSGERGGEAKEAEDRISRWLSLGGSFYDRSLNRVVSYRVSNPALGGLGVALAGLVAGMLGIGAGAFNVSICEAIMRIPHKAATATSNFIIGSTALSGAIVYISSGLVYVDFVAPIAVGMFLGSVLGGKVLNRLSDRVLKYIFSAVVMYAVVQMLQKGISA